MIVSSSRMPLNTATDTLGRVELEHDEVLFLCTIKGYIRPVHTHVPYPEYVEATPRALSGRQETIVS
jgi:hypothetical protein